MSEKASRDVLEAYGIPLTPQQFVSAADIARMDKIDVAFPVAVKVNSAEIPHKSEADGIRLGLTTVEGVRTAGAEVVSAGRAYDSSATIDGILVQEMASGVELIVGAVDDACFGPVVMVGLGGVFAEVLKDVAYRFAPIDHASAREMLDDLAGAKLLTAYRGRKPADPDALADLIVRLSWLIADHAGLIESIDMNPVFANETGAIAADALVVLRNT